MDIFICEPLHNDFLKILKEESHSTEESTSNVFPFLMTAPINVKKLCRLSQLLTKLQIFCSGEIPQVHSGFPLGA